MVRLFTEEGGYTRHVVSARRHEMRVEIPDAVCRSGIKMLSGAKERTLAGGCVTDVYVPVRAGGRLNLSFYFLFL